MLVSSRATHIALAVDGLQQPLSHLLRGCGGRCHCLLGAKRPTGENPPSLRVRTLQKLQLCVDIRHVSYPHVSFMPVSLRTPKSFQPNNEDSPAVVAFRFIAVSDSPIHEANWITTFSWCIMGNWSSKNVITSARARRSRLKATRRPGAVFQIA